MTIKNNWSWRWLRCMLLTWPSLVPRHVDPTPLVLELVFAHAVSFSDIEIVPRTRQNFAGFIFASCADLQKKCEMFPLCGIYALIKALCIISFWNRNYLWYCVCVSGPDPCCQAGIDAGGNMTRGFKVCPTFAGGNRCQRTEIQCCRCCQFGHFIRDTFGEEACHTQAFGRCGGISEDCCLRPRGTLMLFHCAT